MTETTSQAKKSSPKAAKKESSTDAKAVPVTSQVDLLNTIPAEELDGQKAVAAQERGVVDNQSPSDLADQAEEIEIEEPQNEIQILVDRIMVLELALAKFATLSGHANYLREFGLKRWEPSQKDMNKYG